MADPVYNGISVHALIATLLVVGSMLLCWLCSCQHAAMDRRLQEVERRMERCSAELGLLPATVGRPWSKAAAELRTVSKSSRDDDDDDDVDDARVEIELDNAVVGDDADDDILRASYESRLRGTGQTQTSKPSSSDHGMRTESSANKVTTSFTNEGRNGRLRDSSRTEWSPVLGNPDPTGIPPIQSGRALQRSRRSAKPQPSRGPRRHKGKKTRKQKLPRKWARAIKRAAQDELRNRVIPSVRFGAWINPDVELIVNKNPTRTVQYKDGKLTRSSFQPDTVGKYTFWRQVGSTDEAIFSHDQGRGEVTVKSQGTYLIFVQILYDKTGPEAAYALTANHVADSRVLAKCAISQHYEPEVGGNVAVTGNARGGVAHPGYKICATTIVSQLQEGTVVSVESLYVQQSVIIDPASTYWGIVRLGR